MRRVALVLLVVSLLAACAPSGDGSRPLTTEEAQQLAAARFNNYNAGVRPIIATVPGEDGVVVTGWIDFVRHVGYGNVADLDSDAPLGALRWTLDTVGASSAAAELPPVADGWSAAPIDVTLPLNNALAAILSLGSDRPDNPLLLQQTDARWLRTDTVAGVAVTVFAGPSADAVVTAPPDSSASTGTETRFWVDERGTLLRFEARRQGASDWIVVELGSDGVTDLGSVPSIDGQ